MAIRLVALCINCGFSHTGIQELTSCTRLPNKQIDKASEFKELFSQCLKYSLNESYFDSSRSVWSRIHCCDGKGQKGTSADETNS